MAEPDSVPSFLPFKLPASDTDAMLDELYFESENAEGQPPTDTVMSDLNESRTELYSRVQTLKKDLKDWRGMLNSQVKTYREEIGGLRDTLNSEVERLKTGSTPTNIICYGEGEDCEILLDGMAMAACCDLLEDEFKKLRNTVNDQMEKASINLTVLGESELNSSIAPNDSTVPNQERKT